LGTASAVARPPAPWTLWAGILAGPIVWAIDLLLNYAIVKWTCYHDHHWLFDAFTIGSLAVIAAGAVLSWSALQQTANAEPTDGGMPSQRAKFMALLGLATSALFALQVLAAWYPRWILDACR
jgi:hypothetical protein